MITENKEMLEDCIKHFRNLSIREQLKAREEIVHSKKSFYQEQSNKLNKMADFLEDQSLPIREYQKSKLGRATSVLEAVKNAVQEVEEELRELALK